MKESVLKMKPAARWTPDCQGKWDYDGRLVCISTRYWPAGGGFHIYDGRQPERGLHPSSEDFPEIKPSAIASIDIRCGETDESGHNEDYAHLSEKEFEADTEAEVKSQVEDWVRSEYLRIVTCLLREYGKSDLEVM
jgi:hypothetical protein